MTSQTLLHSAINGETLTVDDLFNAPVERVYDAWTKPSELRKWFGPAEGALLDLEIDLQIDGRIMFEFAHGEHRRNAIEGRYIEIVPNQRLVFSWCHVVVQDDQSVLRSPVSRVTITFAAQGNSTHVRLVHDAFSEAARQNISEGWMSTLKRLGEFLGG